MMRLLKKPLLACVLASFLAPQWVLGQASPPTDDAAKLYLQAAKLIGENDSKNIMSPAASDITYPEYPPFSPAWNDMEKVDYAANKPARELAHQARSIDHADWPMVKSPKLDVTYLNQCRNLANELGDAALYEHLQGQDAAAVETLRDLIHLADSLENTPADKTFVNLLVSIGIRALAMDRLQTVIAGVKLTKDSNDATDLQTSVARELMMSIANPPDAKTRLAALSKSEHLDTNPTMGGNIDRVITTIDRVNAESKMAAVSIACHLYRLDSEKWPTTLADLHDYLPNVPLDPFGDKKQTIGYVLIKGALPDGSDRPMVYSRSEATNGLFFRTEQPFYSWYTEDGSKLPPSKQKHGGQFRDVAAWVPKPGTLPSTQPLVGEQ